MLVILGPREELTAMRDAIDAELQRQTGSGDEAPSEEVAVPQGRCYSRRADQRFLPKAQGSAQPNFGLGGALSLINQIGPALQGVQTALAELTQLVNLVNQSGLLKQAPAGSNPVGA